MKVPQMLKTPQKRNLECNFKHMNTFFDLNQTEVETIYARKCQNA